MRTISTQTKKQKGHVQIAPEVEHRQMASTTQETHTTISYIKDERVSKHKTEERWSDEETKVNQNYLLITSNQNMIIHVR